VRLYFFVKVRKASGRNMAGGKRMGRTVGDLKFGGGSGAVRRGFTRWTGVANAGDEEGMGFSRCGFERASFCGVAPALVGTVFEALFIV
jgi:hypothetical protein